MNRLRPCGFTLIEILVVIAVVVSLLGLTFISTGRQQRGAKVQQEAELLAGTLRHARNLAITNRAVYAVVFNIQNKPGSSGAVLNNRSGGHWYRILGPTPVLATITGGGYRSTSSLQDRIPYAGGGANFPEFLTEMQTAWVDEPHVLAAGQARFLALGDTDEGPALRSSDMKAVGARSPIHYGSGGESTYPRPWFGYYDQATQTLWPWGGYEPGKSYSAFHYEGKDGPIVGCVNPNTRAYDNDYDAASGVDTTFQDVDRNGDGDIEDIWERENGIVILETGKPRALVNADWLDAGIAFLPDGTAKFLEWNRSRRYYLDMQVNLTYPPTPQPRANANGVRDMAKVSIQFNPTPVSGYGRETLFTDLDEGKASGVFTKSEDIPEVGHFVRHTGGWHITLGPDARDDRTTFPTAREALTTITPAYRVFVGKNGTVSTIAVKQPEAYLTGKAVWPTDPNDWLSTSTTPASNPVFSRCRIGWLHQPDTGTKPGSLVPRGHPIVDVVTPDMLTRRIWWLDD